MHLHVVDWFAWLLAIQTRHPKNPTGLARVANVVAGYQGAEMNLRADHWKDIEIAGTWVWPRFSLQKMACSHCGKIEINTDFMDRLSALREEFGQPMIETSGYRCADYNASISRTGRSGPHTTGRAVDIAIYGHSAFDLMPLAFKHGFTGIGVRQRGRHSGRFIHLDDLSSEQAPRPRIWSY